MQKFIYKICKISEWTRAKKQGKFIGTKKDIEELIEDKKRKEKEKIIHNWEEEGIKIEKGRWGKFYLVKSKKRILLDKNLDVQTLDLDKAKEIYQANTSKKTKK